MAQASCSGDNDPSCDNYKLTIDPPGSDFQVRIMLQPSGDWDLAVYGPNGLLAMVEDRGEEARSLCVLTPG